MNNFLFFNIITLGVVGFVRCGLIPVKSNEAEDDILKINKENPNLFEGDIEGVSAHTRNAVKDPTLIWTTPIPYVINEQYGWKLRDDIERVLHEYTVRTCVSFTPRTDQTTYVHITRGNGCSSGVGIGSNGGEMGVSLGVGCEGHAHISHEIMHRIGFWHEQSRYDRDDFVNIIWDKITSSMQYNFNKYDNETVDILGLPYDYVSIMHYKDTAFSIDGSKTIVPKDSSITTVGYQNDVTELDIMKINKLYDCSMFYEMDKYTDYTEWGVCDLSCNQQRRRWCDGSACEKWGQEEIQTRSCTGCSVDERQESACKGFITTPNMMTSALYPYIYDNNLDCIETLTVPEGETVHLEFDFLEIESRKGSTDTYTCPWDSLKIFDGSYISDPLLATVCHSSHMNANFKSTGNSMTLRLKTDSSVMKGGFLLYWSSESEFPLFRCNFEGGSIDACEMTSVSTTEHPWVYKNGETPSAATGPNGDNSIDLYTERDTDFGHYIFMETSAPVENGAKAQINTPVITATNTTNCLSFSYNMYGSSMGSLNIYYVPMNSTTSELVFTVSGNQGEGWKQETIEFANDGNEYQLMFEGIRGTSWTGDLAIDDIFISRSGCL